MKKDVNKVLLFLVIAPLLLFTFSSVYYEQKLKNISQEYNQSVKSLQEVTGKAVFDKSGESVQLKETFQKDKEALEKGYYDLKIENEGLKKGRGEAAIRIKLIKIRA